MGKKIFLKTFWSLPQRTNFTKKCCPLTRSKTILPIWRNKQIKNFNLEFSYWRLFFEVKERYLKIFECWRSQLFFENENFGLILIGGRVTVFEVAKRWYKSHRSKWYMRMRRLYIVGAFPHSTAWTQSSPETAGTANHSLGRSKP